MYNNKRPTIQRPHYQNQNHPTISSIPSVQTRGHTSTMYNFKSQDDDDQGGKGTAVPEEGVVSGGGGGGGAGAGTNEGIEGIGGGGSKASNDKDQDGEKKEKERGKGGNDKGQSKTKTEHKPKTDASASLNGSGHGESKWSDVRVVHPAWEGWGRGPSKNGTKAKL